MGILDEAIREHLDLKRQHGAEDTELKKLEDDAFGPPERPGASEAAPDPEAEAPTEFMSQPDLDKGEDAAEAPEEPRSDAPAEPSSRREPATGIIDIQEAPPAAADELEDEPAAADDEELDDEPAAADDKELDDEPAAADDGPDDDEPAEEEQPAGEHETVPGPIEPAGHSTEERHAIADQPTQMYDVEEGFASTEAPAPPDEDLAAEEISEARLGPVEPIAPVDDEEDEDDFFDEQRLSDELDQALEAPAEDQPPVDDEEVEDELGPADGEGKAAKPAPADDSDHDPLEDTPDFLEEAPEDDQLWFEQKPPKDFDFDD